MIIALAGNQNCGKTTLFNQLTGSNQHVGNFPGVTVEQKSGEILGHKQMSLVDLPGIYSLRPYSSEEIVTRDFLLQQKPDGIINIVDGTNIERNLYLTLQMMDLRIPMVIALNMMDEVHANGWSINVKVLGDALGIPVVPISASKNEGVSELVDVLERTIASKQLPTVRDLCAPGPVHRCIHSIMHQIEDHAVEAGIPRRFAATKLIEGDADIQKQLKLEQNELESIEHSVVQMEEERGLDRDAALADMRYTFIENAIRDAVKHPQESRDRTRSEQIDAVLTNRYAAVPIFIGIMLLVFWLTFDVLGSWLSDLLAMGINALSAVVDTGLTAYGINPVVHSLIIEGIFQGVGSVLSFLPIIVVLFFFLSILEDTGYMARVAFVMDSLLRKIGLSGRSIVPMLIGFGCTVPAVMSARTLSSERDRKMTVLLTPFMSCSAKIPIYAIISAAFFPGRGALCMIALYIGGIIAGILSAKLMGGTVLRGKPVPFVMELPNYRFPSPRSVAMLMWEKAKDFLQRAFTVIFVATLVVWFLQTFDARLNVVSDASTSLLAMLGRLIAVIFAPLGFGDWRIATSLVSGFIAKESVISTLEMLSDGALSALLTVRSALSFLTFTLLYTPCVAAISAFKRELGSGWKAAGVAVYQCAFAWVCAFLVFQLAGLFL